MPEDILLSHFNGSNFTDATIATRRLHYLLTRALTIDLGWAFRRKIMISLLMPIRADKDMISASARHSQWYRSITSTLRDKLTCFPPPIACTAPPPHPRSTKSVSLFQYISEMSFSECYAHANIFSPPPRLLTSRVDDWWYYVELIAELLHFVKLSI